MLVNEEMKNEIVKWFDFYEKNIVPVIKSTPEVVQKDYGLHGFYTHTEGVVFRGIYYCLCLGKDPIPVIFACALHDIARTDEIYNTVHQEDAVPIAKKIINQFSDILSDKQKESIVYAIRNHTTGMCPPDYVKPLDYVSVCLWDADRTRAGWIYGYREEFLLLDEAKRVVLGGPADFLEFQNECLGRNLLEDREGVFEHREY